MPPTRKLKGRNSAWKNAASCLSWDCGDTPIPYPCPCPAKCKQGARDFQKQEKAQKILFGTGASLEIW